MIYPELGDPVYSAEVLVCERVVVQYVGDETRNFGSGFYSYFGPWRYHSWPLKANIARSITFIGIVVLVLSEQAWIVENRHMGPGLPYSP